jgi:hypothetical protein
MKWFCKIPILLLLFLMLPGCILRIDSSQLVDYLVAQAVKTVQANPPPALPPVNEKPANESGIKVPNPPAAPADQQVQPGLPTATQLPCYYALLVGENIPDGTTFTGGSTFTKTWTLRNTGSCTWNPNYQLVFSSGERMNAPAGVAINAVVPPGGQVTIPVSFRAPSAGGSFSSYWKMRADNGALFAQVFVKINVPAPTATPRPAPPAFAVTNVVLSAAQNDITVTCGQTDTITTTAIITANGAGVVTYAWETFSMTGGYQDSGPLTVTFTAAGTKTVQYTWTTVIASFEDFNYDLIKNLPAPANSYHNLIEMQCN